MSAQIKVEPGNRPPLKPNLVFGEVDPSRPSVLCYMPHYCHLVDIRAARSLFQEASLGKCNVWTPDGGGSLLGHVFNEGWTAALTARFEGVVTHFAMLHADVQPQAGWLDILVEEMDKHDADVISALVPLKETSGLMSTAISEPTTDPDNDWVGNPLHAIHLCDLPETFSIDDTPWKDEHRELLINTGCMLVDLRKPWVFEQDEGGFLKAFFTVKDRVKMEFTKDEEGKKDIKFTRYVQPEDWLFSRMVSRLGGKVCATRRVSLTHHDGNIGYGSITQEDVDAYKAEMEEMAKQQAKLEEGRDALERELSGEDPFETRSDSILKPAA